MKTKMRNKSEIQKKKEELNIALFIHDRGAQIKFESHEDETYWRGYAAGLEWALGEDKT